ncbi:MAG: helix-turn-helix domain-containing protein, partial [Candidatus Uhrbacteria bacterium]|nr:helix-turn-helix domain-containing protein [Candidatus Uhrbacteria bacterium]
FTMRRHGAKPLVEQIMRGCLSPEQLVLKVGAKVMFTKNNPEHGYVNGTTGEVVAFKKDTGMPEVKLHSGRSIVAEPADWSMVVEGTPLATVIQIPLRLAWAMTVHKSQGMSLDAAFIDLSHAFAYGQGYVALSRVRTLAGLFLGGMNERALEVDPTVLSRDADFRASSAAARSTIESMSTEDIGEAQDNFIRSSGGKVGGGVVYQKPVVKKKESKEQRCEATLKLVASGKSLQEVAKDRKRTVGTIIEHLEKLREQKRLPLGDIVHLRNGIDFTEMHIAFTVVGDAQLKPAFEHLKGKFSYEALRLARIFYEGARE